MLEVMLQDDLGALTEAQAVWLCRVVECAYRSIGPNLDEPASRRLMTVVLVGASEISRLHDEFFADPSVTDVITFPAGDDWFTDESEFGDVVICHPVAIEQAAEASHSACREVAFLALHGMLHLLGFTDETELKRAAMLTKQTELLSACERAVGEAPS